MKGHRTWRIAMCNRNVKKISRALDDLAKQITNKEILKMDGETGKIELINV